MKTGKRYIKVTERRINYYKISEVAAILGISQRTIRYYEQMGLLPSARRTRGRMRLYTDGEIKLIKKIKGLQKDFRMSLEKIRENIAPDLNKYIQQREKGKIKIVVDSTASLPTSIIKKYGIEVIPMKVVFGKSVFDDGENMNTNELLKQLATGRHTPQTQHPSYEEIISIYNNIYERGAEKIIAIHLSSGISDMVLAAQKAAGYIRPLIDIEVIDSRCMALGSGLLAIEAAKMLQDGKDYKQVVQGIKQLIPRVKEVLMIDSLDYLTRGKDVHEYLTLLLDFKPVFTTENGKVKLLARTNDKNEVRKIFVSLAGKAKNGSGIMYSSLKKDADQLHKEIKQKAGIPDPLIKTEISTVPSVYFGPKSIGLVIY